MTMTLAQIHQRVGGEIEGDSDTPVHGVNDLLRACPEEIAYAQGERYLESARASRAGVLVVPPDFPSMGDRPLLRTPDPKALFVGIMKLFDQGLPRPAGVHETAAVAPDAVLGEGVGIGEHVAIRTGVRIGDGTAIESGVHVGEAVVIGRDCYLAPNVVLYPGVRLGDRVTIHAGSVVGGDGFGYVWTGQIQQKVPQLGTVVIEDDVEIGSNTCIDRGTFGETRIRRGAKIDNLVQLAHNDDIGEHSVIVALTGLSGSVTLGRGVVLGGQVGASEHLKIGDGVQAGARTGIIKDVPPGEVILGLPSRPVAKAKREFAAVSLLPRTMRKLRDLERRLRALEAKDRATDED